MKRKSYSDTLFPWLKANGFTHLGGLTGQDFPALKAAVMIAHAYTSSDGDARQHCADAFGAMVRCIQPNYRNLAYHAIAHAYDWGARDMLWQQAGLEPLEHPGRCTNE